MQNKQSPNKIENECIIPDLTEKLLPEDGNSSSEDDEGDFFTVVNTKSSQDNDQHEIKVLKFDLNQAIEIIGDCNFYQIFSCIFFGIIWFIVPSVPIMIPFYRLIPNYTCLNPTDNSFHECSVEEYCDSATNKILNSGNIIRNWETDFNLSCKSSIYYGILSSAYFIGILIGFIFVSNYSNKNGRKKTLLHFLYAYFIISVLMNLYSSIFMIFIYLFLIGIIYSGTTMCAFILIFESTSKQYKAILTTIISMSFGIGALFNIFLFWLIGNWRVLLAISSILCLFLICTSYKIQESPEFWYYKKNYILLKDVLEKIAKMNNREKEFREYIEINQSIEEKNINEFFYDEKDMQKIIIESNENFIESKNENIDALAICFISKYKFKILIMAINWFSMTLTFYGINFSLNNFGMNVFLTGLIVYSSEIIAQFLSMFLIIKIGDKKSIITSYLFSALSLIILQLINSKSFFGSININTFQSPTNYFSVFSLLKILLIFSAKFGISSINNLNYIYTGRIFDTDSRMGAMSFCKIVSRLGAVSSTLLIEITDYSMVIFGFFCILSAFLINVYGKKLEKINT